MDIHYWRNNRERPRFFRSATFICTWNGLRKSIRRNMARLGIDSIEIVLEKKGGKSNMVKWNPKTKNYEKYDPPKEGFYPLYTQNMDLPINCAACGKEIKYGDGFSSRFIHSEG